MLKLKKIKPIGTQILVTEDLYGWDDKNEAGIIINKCGDLKTYQKVVAVGDDVKYIKPGDTVEINLYKYAIFKDDPNSIKAGDNNSMIGLRLNEVELTDVDGEPVNCFLIDFRDIKYVMEDFEEVTYDDKDNLIMVEPPKKQLILPSNTIKV